MATILSPDSSVIKGGVKVNEYLLTKHNPNKIAMPTTSLTSIIGVTVHNTEWINVASGTTPAEQYTRATVNGNMNDVRVHYYVDNECAWQNLPHTLTGWHAADGNGNGNRKTIAIECIMSSAYNDKDKASEDNCAKLAAALLKELGLGIDHLYTHTHWLNVKDGKTGSIDYLNTKKNSYKTCPLYIIQHWESFKAKVESYLGTPSSTNSSSTTVPETKTEEQEQCMQGAVFSIGSTVYVKSNAIDANGKKTSAIYAGANNPLTVKSVSGNIYTLYKGTVPVYRMEGQYLSSVYSVTTETMKVGSVVKIKPGAVWWTGSSVPTWAINSAFYLQQWDTKTGRAVIGTSPISQTGTVTGPIDIKYLEIA